MPRREDSSARKKKSFRSAIILSLSFLIVFTAYFALQNLQSTLHQEEGLGTVALGILYACIIVSGIFAPVCLSKIGVKWSIILAWVGHCLYTTANFYPRWATLVPASVLLGGLTGPLWTSQCVYLANQAFIYADASGQTPASVLSKFNGIFFTMIGSTQITGNLVSSLVLKQDSDLQVSLNGNSTHSPRVCGALDCPTAGNVSVIAEHDPTMVYTLLGVFVGLDLVGVLGTAIFLPALERRPDEKKSVTKSALSCGKLIGDSRMALLIPLITFMAMEQGILWTEFTKSYISCPLGVGMVGYIMAAFGGSAAVFSLLFGRFAAYTGRYLMFGFAGSLNLALFIALVFWQPSSQGVAVQFVLVILWGLAEGIWQTQSNALMALVFRDGPDPAFANYHSWKAVGFTVTFATSSFLCVSTKLYIAIGLLSFSMVMYVVLELRLKFDKSIKSRYELAPTNDRVQQRRNVASLTKGSPLL